MSSSHDIFVLVLLMVVSFVLSYFGASVGLVLGNIRLPLLVYALGSPVNATGTNLGISIMGALAGSYFHMREGRINLRLLLSIGIPSMIGAIFGVFALSYVRQDWAKLLIGLMLIYSGYKLTKPKESKLSKKEQSLRHSLFREGSIGIAIGVLSGAVGLMLSSIRLPTMIRVLNIDPKEAIGTNLAISFVTGLAGTLTSLWVSGTNLLIIATVAPATLAGSYLGARFVANIDPLKLRRLLAYTLMGTGCFMFVESIQKL